MSVRTQSKQTVHLAAFGRLKAQHSRVAAHYQIAVAPDEAGEKAVAVTWTRRPHDGSMATHPGVYCLRSSETDWDEDALWRTYTTLTDVEAVFRSLKSELGLRPQDDHLTDPFPGRPAFVVPLAPSRRRKLLILKRLDYAVVKLGLE